MSEIKEKSPHAKLDLIEGDMTSFKCACALFMHGETLG